MKFIITKTNELGMDEEPPLKDNRITKELVKWKYFNSKTYRPDEEVKSQYIIEINSLEELFQIVKVHYPINLYETKYTSLENEDEKLFKINIDDRRWPD